MPMYILTLVVIAVGYVATWLIVRELRLARTDARRDRMLAIMTLFAPAIAAARTDPRTLLAWQPLAHTARQLWPDDFALLDQTSGSTFPFSRDVIDAAHAQWTTDWLAWERAHDAEYKLKAAEAEHELAASGGAPFLRAKLEAIEREKLDRYQRRYQEYVQVGKALKALIDASSQDTRS
jgi:hypothetical protein